MEIKKTFGGFVLGLVSQRFILLGVFITKPKCAQGLEPPSTTISYLFPEEFQHHSKL